ncbi:MAG: phosphoribosylformylglycinamidine cyclo-ligase [Kiritimatiellae bacterium]|nr:phosphoribosylformylglycinamidine cyclo-ligase [Kiritimatiellia bacterium]
MKRNTAAARPSASAKAAGKGAARKAAGSKSAYAAAGVDIDEMDRGLAKIKADVKSTKTPGVLSDIGRFGGLFASPGRGEILVASTDGVGTKLKIAHMAGIHNTVGEDLVNHCVNDILTQGATPLFFLDYLGTSKLDADVFAKVIAGFCRGCRNNGLALLGGETAEMPGLYPASGEYDLCGTIVGRVSRRELVTGEDIREGDMLVGLPSTGLQTNGYSLARKILFDVAKLSLSDFVPGTRTTFKKALLAVHGSFLKPVLAVREAGVKIRGMAHVTGGGLLDNVPRMLPAGVDAAFDCSTWKVPAVFRFFREAGGVDPVEMYRVFNMGVGYVLCVRQKDLARTVGTLERTGVRPVVAGQIVRGSRRTRLENIPC